MVRTLGKFKQLATSRITAVAVLLILQVVIVAILVAKLSEYFALIYAAFLLLSLAVFLYVINKNDNPSYKLAWAIPIMIFPLFGGVFYLLLGSHSINKILLKRS